MLSLASSGVAAGFTDNFDTLNASNWQLANYAGGYGSYQPANVSVAGGKLAIKVPANTKNGGQIIGKTSYKYGTFSTSMKTCPQAGALSTFWLYQRSSANDEIDIEVHGTVAGFTVYKQGVKKWSKSVSLGFDPSAAFHQYKIVWSANAVTFYVDNAQKATYTTTAGIPTQPMYVLASVWWPTWLTGGTSASATYGYYDWIKVQ